MWPPIRGRMGIIERFSHPSKSFSLCDGFFKLTVCPTRLIRASDHPEAQSIPVIAMTANVFVKDIQTRA